VTSNQSENFAGYSHDQLMGLLSTWNAELVRNGADVILPVAAAAAMPDPDLRSVLRSTAKYLTRIVDLSRDF
jgi:hypothetical protein